MNQNEQDYQEELQFVKDHLQNKMLISDYPYYKSYDETTFKELNYLHGKLLVVGSGPLPLTMYMLGGMVDGLDSSFEAVDYGNRFLRKAGICDFTLHCAEAELFNSYKNYDSILLTLEAGPTLESKAQVLDKLYSDMKVGANLIVRSSNTEGDFVNAQSLIASTKFKLVDTLSVFDGLSTSFVLTKT